MLKLKQPAYTYADMLTSCREGITGNPGLLLKVNEAITDLQTLAASYSASASTGELYTIQPLKTRMIRQIMEMKSLGYVLSLL